MPTQTSVFNLNKPTVSGDADVWGGSTGLNGTIDKVEAALKATATTGSANAYVLTTGLSLTAYATGQTFRIIPNFTNSGAATINVDGLGAKNITKTGATALASGDLVSGRIYTVSYDGVQFQVVEINALESTLSTIAALTPTTDQAIYFTGTDTAATMAMTAAGRAMVGAASASAQAALMGLVPGSAATVVGSVTLTSASASAQRVTTTALNQFLQLPDATTLGAVGGAIFTIQNAGGFALQIRNSAGTALGWLQPGAVTTIGLADKSTAAGVWMIDYTGGEVSIAGVTHQAALPGTVSLGAFGWYAVALDANRTFFLYPNSSQQGTAVVFDVSDSTFGTPVLVWTNVSFPGAGQPLLLSADTVFCGSATGTDFQGVIATISGKAITLGTIATQAAGATFQSEIAGPILVGSSIVFAAPVTAGTETWRVVACTVSGTTVTFGTSVASYANAGTTGQFYLYASGADKAVLVLLGSSSQMDVFTISGTTVSRGTGISTLGGGTNANGIVRLLPDGRWFVATAGTASLSASLVSLSGTTLSASTTGSTALANMMTTNAGNGEDVAAAFNASGTKVALVACGSVASSAVVYCALMTNTSGTASWGTTASINLGSSGSPWYVTDLGVVADVAYFAIVGGTVAIISVNMAGTNPVITLLSEGLTFSDNVNPRHPPPKRRMNGALPRNAVLSGSEIVSLSPFELAAIYPYSDFSLVASASTGGTKVLRSSALGYLGTFVCPDPNSQRALFQVAVSTGGTLRRIEVASL